MKSPFQRTLFTALFPCLFNPTLRISASIITKHSRVHLYSCTSYVTVRNVRGRRTCPTWQLKTCQRRSPSPLHDMHQSMMRWNTTTTAALSVATRDHQYVRAMRTSLGNQYPLVTEVFVAEYDPRVHNTQSRKTIYMDYYVDHLQVATYLLTSALQNHQMTSLYRTRFVLGTACVCEISISKLFRVRTEPQEALPLCLVFGVGSS